ncbi:MAG: hypothetical protein A3D44_02985 [Candidatus Staskawiczbacteria bacterium RIFCSPHIGHO2_02_FULL_42_22]|uniref:Uncharacterized protein n=1 Tax=Candidatus Staskawiczbacteria bacterium RIFCSPHIGHO2_02_FULL_42_22 TaxID=1802207 RepID=A0A1G2I5W1_9BACT|nr:MAG: hypothetical protein A3D44_02985 [Candidatus Staskawiczbacteria bacterium RIFCSPHIGHO2_02_FULL_42_22]
MSETLQMKLMILTNGIINGFCYAFCKAHLRKLKDLMEKDEVMKKDDLSSAICQALAEQTGISRPNRQAKEKLHQFINTIEEYLSIFEVPEIPDKKYTSIPEWMAYCKKIFQALEKMGQGAIVDTQVGAVLCPIAKLLAACLAQELNVAPPQNREEFNVFMGCARQYFQIVEK